MEYHYIKNLLAVQETHVWSLGQEDPLQKELANHSSILTWRIPDIGAWWATVHGIARVGHDLAIKTQTTTPETNIIS